MRGLPGVEAVGLVETVPLDEGAVNAELVTKATATDEEGRPRGAITLAAGDYFQAMGIDVLRGRAFTEEDLSVPGRVVVSRSAAETLWPGEAPIVGPERRLPATGASGDEEEIHDLSSGNASPFGTKSRATPLLQYRFPVGGGPSSKTCPWCPPQRAQ